MEKILVYVGVNHGVSFDKLAPNFDYSIGFEPQPFLADKLIAKYKECKNVEIVPAAIGLCDGKADFYISSLDNDRIVGASSSFFQVSDYYRNNGPRNQIFTKEKIIVPTLNLFEFLVGRGISEIDTIITDAEGFDFEIIKSISPLISSRRVRNIQVECELDYVTKEQREGQPGNYMSYFLDLLLPHYDLTSIQPGCYDPRSNDRWFNRDLIFRLKQ